MATPEELASVGAALVGQTSVDRIEVIDVPRPSRGVRDAFLGLEDMCSDVSDALDKLGVGGTLSASALSAVIPDARVCGPAITLRYAELEGAVVDRWARGERPRLADRDLYAVSQVGDVAVVHSDAGANVSIMGAASAQAAIARGLAACITDGGVRDISALRGGGLPIWSAGRTPTSGRQRLEAVSLNSMVELGGVQVEAGDLICADETGVCVIPRAFIDLVLDLCEQAAAAERAPGV